MSESQPAQPARRWSLVAVGLVGCGIAMSAWLMSDGLRGALADSHGHGEHAGEGGHDDEHGHEDGHHGEEHHDDRLHDLMEDLGRSYRQLVRHAANPERRGDALAAVQAFQVAAVEAKLVLPHGIEAMPEGEARDAATAEYRGLMVTLLIHSLEAENALLEARYEDAAAAVGQMYQLQEIGHQRFLSDH